MNTAIDERIGQFDASRCARSIPRCAPTSTACCACSDYGVNALVWPAAARRSSIPRTRSLPTFGGRPKQWPLGRVRAMKSSRSPFRSMPSPSDSRARNHSLAILQGLELNETNFFVWLKAVGKDRRAQPRIDQDQVHSLPRARELRLH